ncbi:MULTISPECIES: hypothetical protein [unclassified Meiothermus]|uniref:DUF6848 family protein n=1 Tax=unclassified Meiothermus TaxID=370471 RepID=UPI000D7BE06F|nr:MULTISPECIES: hypothetical protein [unclassified Meiothermus]PZA07792.1 hypothetical protein DNA98_05650 [Meiothermus sp. Pnk-1]RYM38906.1 hypothetical protein EWH23_04035 [Meiothermus sp. PNK-Is4]
MEKAFYTFEHEGVSYRFSRPSAQQIDATIARARKSPTEAAASFTRAIIDRDQREAWDALLAEYPGFAQRVTEGVLEKLGFPIGG